MGRVKKGNFLSLNPFCYLIKGAKKACIYDLLNGDLFSIDERVSKIFEDKGGKTIEISERDNLTHALDTLISSGLVIFTGNKVFTDRVKLNFIEDTAQERIPQLRRLWIRICSDCNINCIFCNKIPLICFVCSKSLPYIKDEIEDLELKNALYEASLFNCREVKFIGGDPFANEKLLKVLPYTFNLFRDIEVFSNLTSLPKEFIKLSSKIKEKITIIFPVFSDEKSHDLVTGKNGNFQRMIENAFTLIKNKFKVKALIVKLRKRSYNDIIAFLNYRKIKFSVFSPIPFLKEKKLFELFDGFLVKSLFERTDIYSFFYRKSYNQCWGQQLLIDINGDVKPCLFAKHTLGNILHESLRNILRECRQEKYWNLTKDRVNICKECEFRYCCSFDCRVASEALNGGIDSKYPFYGKIAFKNKRRILE